MAAVRETALRSLGTWPSSTRHLDLLGNLENLWLVSLPCAVVRALATSSPPRLLT
jgi:hypothetical protein